jgi:hypothetical protein
VPDGIAHIEDIRLRSWLACGTVGSTEHAAVSRPFSRHSTKDVPMRHSYLASACFLLLVVSPAVRAGGPGPDCCSTYPIYLCPPGYLGYPAPPRDLNIYQGCFGCSCNSDSATACARITPNPYSCCFYGITVSNYGLITPLSAINAVAPSKLPAPLPAPEKLPAPTTPK